MLSWIWLLLTIGDGIAAQDATTTAAPPVPWPILDPNQCDLTTDEMQLQFCNCRKHGTLDGESILALVDHCEPKSGGGYYFVFEDEGQGKFKRLIQTTRGKCDWQHRLFIFCVSVLCKGVPDNIKRKCLESRGQCDVNCDHAAHVAPAWLIWLWLISMIWQA
eukprot:gnl/MRDRNA2_/MRDRNA2_89179_c0_seq1.p1 gnl/MRDRNA2_/MRDRNA2_89179_c0~~gnl/MRDRNA2_/MRDRNA2_89179_c0_seq1.p1  ORF type:complete len:162 (-),score=29.55 gnl/MRDRNA2_/MRDRNA2_89179_c0_seq1:59-544(-)